MQKYPQPPGADYRFVCEGERPWMSVSRRSIDRERTSENVGFKETAGHLASGRQWAIGENWRTGLGLSYERT